MVYKKQFLRPVKILNFCLGDPGDAPVLTKSMLQVVVKFTYYRSDLVAEKVLAQGVGQRCRPKVWGYQVWKKKKAKLYRIKQYISFLFIEQVQAYYTNTRSTLTQKFMQYLIGPYKNSNLIFAKFSSQCFDENFIYY